jgi:hypothetical protein
MAAWKTFRLTLDVLVKADDEDELPDAEGVKDTVEESTDELAETIGSGLLSDTEISISVKDVRELALPDPPVLG